MNLGMNPMESLNGLSSAFPRCSMGQFHWLDSLKHVETCSCQSAELLTWHFTCFFLGRVIFAKHGFVHGKLFEQTDTAPGKGNETKTLQILVDVRHHPQKFTCHQHCLHRLLVLDVSFIELPSVAGAWQALAELSKLQRLVAEGCSLCSFEDWEELPSLKTLDAGL